MVLDVPMTGRPLLEALCKYGFEGGRLLAGQSLL